MWRALEIGPAFQLDETMRKGEAVLSANIGQEPKVARSPHRDQEKRNNTSDPFGTAKFSLVLAHKRILHDPEIATHLPPKKNAPRMPGIARGVVCVIVGRVGGVMRTPP